MNHLSVGGSEFVVCIVRATNIDGTFVGRHVVAFYSSTFYYDAGLLRRTNSLSTPERDFRTNSFFRQSVLSGRNYYYHRAKSLIIVS